MADGYCRPDESGCHQKPRPGDGCGVALSLAVRRQKTVPIDSGAAKSSRRLARDDLAYRVPRFRYDLGMTESRPLPFPAARRGQVASIDAVATIPEEDIWLASQKSERFRRASRQDVPHFMNTRDHNQGPAAQGDHRAVIAWDRFMGEHEGAAASTMRRRLAALSSLFKHPVLHSAAGRNPVVDVHRPAIINHEQGRTVAFSNAQASRHLDAPPTIPWPGRGTTRSYRSA